MTKIGFIVFFPFNIHTLCVQLANGIELNLGRQEFIDRLQRFIDVYPLLAKQPKAVKYVDLRYDTGLAVGWQDAQDKKS